MKKLIFLIIFISPQLLLAQQTHSVELHFDFGKYHLRTESVQLLGEFLAKYHASSNARIFIKGHTDSIGSHDYNLELSRKRAEEVAAFLKENGVSDSVLQINFHGKTRPLSTNRTDEGRQANRRVLVYFEEIVPMAEIEEECEDMVFTAAQGAMVIVDCECMGKINGLKGIRPEIDEFYTSTEMMENNIVTRDINGNCLVSGGMIRMKVQGWEMPLDEDGNRMECFTIRIPVLEFDEDMQLYSAEMIGGTVNWRPMETNPELYEDDNGRQFYQFRQADPDFFINVDKAITGSPVLAVRNLFRQPLSVKARNAEFNYAYLINTSETMLLDTRFRTFRKRGISDCINSETLVLTSIKVKDRDTEINVPLSDLKFSRWRNIYIIKKADLRNYQVLTASRK